MLPTGGRSVRERLEAAGSGLRELELLRQRQEELVRAALELRDGEQGEPVRASLETQEEEQEERREARLSSEEKLLEENILLLRKQLNCLRRRDAGLMSQLQELDRQISDLRLDNEVDQPEMDSRPSSGFYELSDGASGSLSNSSNSVFSECLCNMADNEGRLLSTGTSTDDPSGCLECDGLINGLFEDLSCSGTVRRSFSAPHPPTVDVGSLLVPGDAQSKYHCDLLPRGGGDVYRYPSPLHAVVVQSPTILLGHCREESEGHRSENSSLVPQSSSWPVSFPSPSGSSLTPPTKRLDSYIFSLVQKRNQPIRTNKPRTSISTEPSKSVLRQASLCTVQVSSSGSGTLRASELKPSRQPTEGVTLSSLLKQGSVEGKCEDQDNHDMSLGGTSTTQGKYKLVSGDHSSPHGHRIQDTSFVCNTNTQGDQGKERHPPPACSTTTRLRDFREPNSPKVSSSPKENNKELLNGLPQANTPKTGRKNCPEPLHGGPTERYGPAVVKPTLGLACFSEDEDKKSQTLRKVQQHKVCKSGIKKSGKVKGPVMPKTSRVSDHNQLPPETRANKSNHRSKKSCLLDNGGSAHTRTLKRGTSSRTKQLSIPEERVLDNPGSSTPLSIRSGGSKHRHHANRCHRKKLHPGNHQRHQGREQVVVVTKLKHKRSDYRPVRVVTEGPLNEALRRAGRGQKKEQMTVTSTPGGLISPYAYTAGSDSEYSAECASLFHSTIVDTSEDEKSNYTTNCFGDSEDEEEEAEESDTEESGGGGAGRTARVKGHGGATGGRKGGKEDMVMTPAQAKAFVKIRASHNLKRKILRFRSGSLRLMTTV